MKFEVRTTVFNAIVTTITKYLSNSSNLNI